MGQKASTPATSGQQSPRSRTFSSSSTGAAVDTSPAGGGRTGGGASATGIVGAVGGGGDATGQGFNLLRTLPGLQVYHHQQNSTTIDRQRARSLSSVPDIQQQQQQQQHQQSQIQSSDPNAGTNINNSYPSSAAAGVTNNNGSSSITPATYMQQQRRTLGDSIRDMSMTGSNIVESIALATSANGIGRVYTATSLPSHIWSFNGIKCPVCNKFVLPDDIECHLVMCLTKPRLSYNEDILSDAKGECVICLEDLSPGDTIARLPCLCIYHKGCIDRWFEVNRSCPEHPGD
ncbi:uncharacterized protein Dwil_GK16393 [Drosophila willistoni]|uniref:E3 ubiquitin-protein ligase ZNRF1 n=1 Tax=Drosophila willistoni TaxID=7260 RepID=B4N1Y0_DROWI|nr:E3 ubiquitin-protein ligase znrf2 [Drosophila willistoni]XP_023032704.1 E3 ubiquitin-protein ligase znrf2 [Drosophila willistoni]XP_046867460.1 E3 ubiquitin-protein ligase znrf2 [Drosophila willistoni]EDW78369.1 uncharacterized protein Dwil_GK16393 [Drosophila willistoni]